jgi:hypothetical protein
MSRGLGYEGGVDPYMANLVVRCDGTRRLGELVAELAASLGQPVSDVAQACVSIAANLIERGILSP